MPISNNFDTANPLGDNGVGAHDEKDKSNLVNAAFDKKAEALIAQVGKQAEEIQLNTQTDLVLPHAEIVALNRTDIAPGTVTLTPQEVPQFSMQALNNVSNRIAYISESFNKFVSNPANSTPAASELRQAQFSAVNLTPQVLDNTSHFSPVPVSLINNADNIISQPSTTIFSDLNDYPKSISGNNLNTNEAETMIRRGDSSAAGASGGGGGNPLWGFTGGFPPSWHHGFLNALRTGNIALGVNNRSIVDDEDDEDEENKKNKQLWA